MASIVLSRDEVYEICGYKRPSKQIAWLKRHGVRFMVGADGYPRVPRHEWQKQEVTKRSAPNFDGVHRVG